MRKLAKLMTLVLSASILFGFMGCSDESDENKSTSKMVGTYKTVDHTAKLDVKADYTIFVDTGYDEYNMNGSWKETAKGGEFTFPDGEGGELVGTAEIKEDDVIWCVSEDMDMRTYAVKISNTAVDMKGTWSNGTMTTTVDAEGNFSIRVSEDSTITGTVTVEGNSFVMEDSEGEEYTGVVSASGKAYMEYYNGEDMVQDIFEKQDESDEKQDESDEKQDESDEKQDESDENKSTSEIVGTYKTVDHAAKLDVKADYTIFVDTGSEEYNMDGSWEETAEGGEFTFPAGEGVELVGTAEIEEDDVIWCVCEDMGMYTYAVKISNTAVDMEGTWSNGKMTTTIDADGNFSIPMSEDLTITGKATVEGNSFVMEDSDGEVVSTGVVSASGKAYMQYDNGEDLVQDVFVKQ